MFAVQCKIAIVTQINHLKIWHFLLQKCNNKKLFEVELLNTLKNVTKQIKLHQILGKRMEELKRMEDLVLSAQNMNPTS